MVGLYFKKHVKQFHINIKITKGKSPLKFTLFVGEKYNGSVKHLQNFTWLVLEF